MDIVSNAFNNIDPNNLQFVQKNMEIVECIERIMLQKGISKKELAQSMGASKSEINQYFSGFHDFTLRELTKIEVVLGEEVFTRSEY